MRKLPPKGLIVSCYLKSMRGCEHSFISAVAHLPEIVALRVEGTKNIAFARSIAPDRYIIGIVKRGGGGIRQEITSDFITASHIMQAGADMVATDSRDKWRHTSHFPVMLDIRNLGDLPHGSTSFRVRLDEHNIVIATTHREKAFALASQLREWYPDSLINLEGGIETPEEVVRGLEIADYVTVGKAINDPPTIVRRLVGATSSSEED